MLTADAAVARAMQSLAKTDPYLDCPLCLTTRNVTADRGALAKVLSCGAVVIVTHSGLLWFNFDEHKADG